jgi:hypothetical protein
MCHHRYLLSSLQQTKSVYIYIYTGLIYNTPTISPLENAILVLPYKVIHFAGTWSGKYRPVAVDERRYAVFEYCCKKLNTSE